MAFFSYVQESVTKTRHIPSVTFAQVTATPANYIPNYASSGTTAVTNITERPLTYTFNPSSQVPQNAPMPKKNSNTNPSIVDTNIGTWNRLDGPYEQTVPSGGTWAYFILGHNGSQINASNIFVDVVAGGTVIGTPERYNTGVLWRIN